MKICCLTFDDGPSKYTPQVLAALEKCDAKATFFCHCTGREPGLSVVSNGY